MISSLKKTWSLFTPSEKRRAVVMLVLIALMALAETGSVVTIMPFLAVLGRPEVVHENHWLELVYTTFGFESTRSFMVALGVFSAVAVIGSSAFKTVTLHLVNRFVHLTRHSISARLLSRYLHQPYEFFLMRNPSELSRNVLSEVDELLFKLMQPLSQLIAYGAVLLTVLLLIILYNPLIALAVMTTLALLYGAIYGLVRRRLAHIGHERQAANGERFKACGEVLGGIKDVKVTHATDIYQKKFNRASRTVSRHSATSETLAQSPLYLVEATGFTGLILISLYFMLTRGDIAHVLPAIGLYGFAAYRMLPAAQIMYRGFARLRFSAPALDIIHRDLGLQDETPPEAGHVLAPKKEIRLQSVSYAYPSAPDKPILNNLDLSIPAGTSLGIAGPSGAGKSTLMDILLGLLTPQSGSLLIDGQPVTKSIVSAWQRAIGYVPQHIYLADASVAENIAFGVPPGQIDMQAVKKAAKAAQIHDFVATELKDGYETEIGDRGIRLSGGQRQRIGIARALYNDPPVLLMDEATSALDERTETIVNNAVQELIGQKTIIQIAHRNSTLKNCQKMIRLANTP